MPKTKISEFSATPGNNTDIDGINIAEGCAPSGINDAIRELMAQLKDFQAGTAGDSFNGPIGSTTPAAGTFTNLSASGTFALTGDQVQISEGGTGQTTANAAFNALAPSQSTHAGKYLKTDGTNTSWDAIEINTADITGTLPVANGGTGVTSSTGTGSVVLSASPTFTGTVNGAALTLSSSLTLSGGTANGVAYLNGSKVLTTGSALSFDGNFLAAAGASARMQVAPSTTTNLALFQSTNTGGSAYFGLDSSTGGLSGTAYALNIYHNSNYPIIFSLNSAEQMRLTSTGLGIGTSSPLQQLHLSSASATGMQITYQGVGAARIGLAAGNLLNFGLDTSNGTTTRMTLDSSGNLGLGVTPSAWTTANSLKAIQVGPVGSIYSLSASASNNQTILSSNEINGASGPVYLTSDAATRYRQFAGTHAWLTAPSGTAGNAISFTQAMTLDAGGRLLLGVTSAAGNAGFQLKGASSGYVRVEGTSSTMFAGDAPQLISGAAAQDSAIRAEAALLFATGGGTERARITSTGSFSVNASTSVSTGTNTLQDSGSSPNTLRLYNNTDSNNATNRFLICDAAASVLRAEIRSNGGLANYQANNVNLSDQRLKTDVQPAGTYLDKICAIPVKTFLYKDQTDTERNLGVMAQDVDAVAPELIDHSGFGEAPEGESPYLAVYQTDLQYALMKCIQELKAQNDDLRARVAQLEAK